MLINVFSWYAFDVSVDFFDEMLKLQELDTMGFIQLIVYVLIAVFKT